MMALVAVALLVLPPLGFSVAIDRLVIRQRRGDARMAALAGELRWLLSRRPPWPELRRELELVRAGYGPMLAWWCTPPLLRLLGVELAYAVLIRLRPLDARWSWLVVDLRRAGPVAAAGILLVALAVFAASAVVLRRWQHPRPAPLLGPRTVLVPPVLAACCWNLPVLLALWIVLASALHAGRVVRLAGSDRWEAEAAPGLEHARKLRSLLEAVTHDRLAVTPAVQRQVVWLLALQPEQGLELFETLLRLDPDGIGGRLRAAALRAQVRAAPATLAQDWPVLERRLVGTFQDRPDEVLGALGRALRLLPPGLPSRWFRRQATRLLLAHLDGEVRVSARPPGWPAMVSPHRLRLVGLAWAGPPPLDRGQVWCILGDLAAADDGRRREAAARYRAALRDGFEPARDRLAGCLAAQGRASLGRGHARVARKRLAAARGLRDDPSYRLLETVSWIVAPSRATTDPELLADLESLRRDGVEPAVIGFWTAALHLLRARPEMALAALREHQRRELGEVPSWDAADQLVLLRAALEDDEPALAAAATILAASDTPWRRQGPVAPAPMLAVVARQDRQLLAELARTVGEPAALPRWARLIAAHGAMERTLRLVERSPLEAKESFDLARRLLGRRLA